MVEGSDPTIRSHRHTTALSPGQLGSLAGATARELVWGLRAVSREVRGWRRRAASIPDGALRADALRSLSSKRASTDGAALFWTLPDGRDPNLLRLLVAFEVMADFLDNVSERGVEAGTANGIQLHVALSEALDPGAPVSAYYRHHPWREDGGYLCALVRACRERCSQLPHYGDVRAWVIGAATLARMLGLNHEPDPELRDTALREWARREAHSWGSSSGSSPPPPPAGG